MGLAVSVDADEQSAAEVIQKAVVSLEMIQLASRKSVERERDVSEAVSVLHCTIDSVLLPGSGAAGMGSLERAASPRLSAQRSLDELHGRLSKLVADFSQCRVQLQVESKQRSSLQVTSRALQWLARAELSDEPFDLGDLDLGIGEMIAQLQTTLVCQQRKIAALSAQLAGCESQALGAKQAMARLLRKMEDFELRVMLLTPTARSESIESTASARATSGPSPSVGEHSAGDNPMGYEATADPLSFLPDTVADLASGVERLQQACLSAQQTAKRLQKDVASLQEKGGPQLEALEGRLADTLERVRELEVELKERDLHLSVQQEGEKQQRQLLALFKEKAAHEAKQMQAKLKRLEEMDMSTKELRAQNDQLSSQLALTRHQLNELKSQGKRSASSSPLSVG
eukprot:NODE_1628_length_1465_cov_31.083333_g1470_i0.p1 GENE.NODE_1628_length_1465_cov_31.083333_g1470_i0~~NODE_1628_length_1465_cov_31.083333_g1470_i0.p1  ORF type:complete len:400 (-),score=93.57 NODE_1628_length_1465_cov_31.083333_g1470_i0:236-1435(-)